MIGGVLGFVLGGILGFLLMVILSAGKDNNDD